LEPAAYRIAEHQLDAVAFTPVIAV
jgi:hypothetical protein